MTITGMYQVGRVANCLRGEIKVSHLSVVLIMILLPEHLNMK